MTDSTSVTVLIRSNLVFCYLISQYITRQEFFFWRGIFLREALIKSSAHKAPSDFEAIWTKKPQVRVSSGDVSAAESTNAAVETDRKAPEFNL